MTLKQFQSGHEVLAHYVNSYRPAVASNRPYENGPSRMTGEVLASALLQDLTNALAELSPRIADPEATASAMAAGAVDPGGSDLESVKP